MNIVLANDHGAVELSNKIREHLEKNGHVVNHLGVKEEVSVDYPDMAELACKEYLKGNYDFGILCCGTGIGISISANKINGIRCALPQNIFASKMAKEHNNVNFIAFGGRIDYPENPLDMLDAFIEDKFAGDRHERRVAKIMALEN
ncbi:MAG: RpiB/LacA/LacB family sugar-phosphate isomerase [Spirochaetia bacterium]|nr:RpiB/LacA/LacB family sugar-phosphate isomerase [Spirochaetia bacterium]